MGYANYKRIIVYIVTSIRFLRFRFVKKKGEQWFPRTGVGTELQFSRRKESEKWMLVVITH